MWKGNREIGKKCDPSAQVHTSTGEPLTVVQDAPRASNYAAEAAKRVVFPAPLTPRTASICPGSIVNVTLSSARTPPYRFDSDSTDILIMDAESNVSVREVQPPRGWSLVYLASLFSTSQGGVMVEVSGHNHAGARTVWLSAYAGERGETIPALLPSLATQMLLRGEVTCRGIISLPDWLPREKFVEELSKRELKMARKMEGT